MDETVNKCTGLTKGEQLLLMEILDKEEITVKSQTIYSSKRIYAVTNRLARRKLIKIEKRVFEARKPICVYKLTRSGKTIGKILTAFYRPEKIKLGWILRTMEHES